MRLLLILCFVVVASGGGPLRTGGLGILGVSNLPDQPISEESENEAQIEVGPNLFARHLSSPEDT